MAALESLGHFVVEYPTRQFPDLVPVDDVDELVLGIAEGNEPIDVLSPYRLALVRPGPDRRHDALRVVGTTSADAHPIDLQESFAFDEVVPKITAQAERRLQAIAEVMARRVSEEAERRG